MAKGSNLTLAPIGVHLLDFNAIYDIGREEGCLVVDGVIKTNGVPEEKIRALQDNMGQIIKLALASKFGLRTRFIELSLFDPKDPEGESFYTVLVGMKEVVDNYLKQMNQNLKPSAKNTARDRGALIPESTLYKAPFYGARYKPSIKCEDWSLENASIYFGRYKSPVRAAKPPPFESMNNLVHAFFDDVMNNTLKNDSGTAKADMALLIPLARPAGMVMVDSPNRLRGGGLFIFGELKNERKVSAGRLALYLLSELNRAIMAISYSSIEHFSTLDKQRSAQYAFEAHEVRKVIRFIDSSYPPHVLEEVKYYFNTLFAATYDHDYLSGTEGILPPEFAKGENFKEFFTNAMLVASRIELMVKKLERHRSYETREELHGEAEAEVSRLDFCARCEAEPLSDDKMGWQTRWALCSTLICVLRNVLKHSRALTPVFIDIEEDENSHRTIVIRNVSRQAHSETQPRHSPANYVPGKSYEAICYLIKQYEGDPGKVKMQPEVLGDYDYVTTVPFP
jgi:hypothetical protein